MVRRLLALLAAVVGLVACFGGSAGAHLPLRAAVANDIGQPSAAVSAACTARAYGGAPEPAIYVYDAAASATTPLARTRMAAHRGYDALRNVSRAHTFAISARLATKEAPAVVRGGETAATRNGREIHKTFDYGRVSGESSACRAAAARML